jgi:lipopolysaccharide transport system ATP-binding protein
MSDAIISVENLGKMYRIRHQQAGRYTALRDVIAERFAALFRKAAHPGQPPAARRAAAGALAAREDFWALKGVSFEVQPGEVVGIIGRNGAGKSTLLKLLSRITEPTAGCIRLRGRVASLLEVGTGFHPELTGRENIFLNGAILGMTKVEIKKKFDEIVAFSEVEKFLDTPVKRYSSGMYVRLAFAVAAHLEPEILVVDEVLAVGDAQFQKKCLGKMSTVAREGRTVLFVSHNMAAVRTLCTRGIVIEGGQVVCDDRVDSALDHYLTLAYPAQPGELAGRTDRLGDGTLRFTAVRFRNRAGECVEGITSGEPLTIEVDYTAKPGLDPARLVLAFSFFDSYQNPVVLFASDEMGVQFPSLSGEGTMAVEIPQFLLRGAIYTMKLIASYAPISPDNFCDVVEGAATLCVLPGDFWKSGRTNRSGTYPVMAARMTARPAGGG